MNLDEDLPEKELEKREDRKGAEYVTGLINGSIPEEELKELMERIYKKEE